MSSSVWLSSAFHSRATSDIQSTLRCNSSSGGTTTMTSTGPGSSEGGRVARN